MATAPAAYPPGCVCRYELAALLAIHSAPLQLPEPATPGPVVTVCFWLWAQAAHPTQVIVNCGHRHAGEPGWSCFLQNGRLVASVCTRQGEQIAVDHAWPEDDRWHHVAVIFDAAQPAAAASLDGVPAGWTPSAISLHPAAPAGGGEGLIVGGYTDAAGGHFDYSFGRGGTGTLDDLRIYSRALATGEIASFRSTPRPAPHAGFTWGAPGLEAPVRICFTAAGSDGDGDGGGDRDCATYLWTWHDGAHSMGRTVTRDFTYAGSYCVRLDVIDAQHAQARAEQVLVLRGAANPLRIIPVFLSGEAGYAAFRIPSIVRAANGDLVAFAEGRVESASDSTATIRIVCKHSSDNGRSWSPLRVVARNLLAGAEYAAMNPSPVVDTVHGTGRIILLFKKLECSEWEIVQGRGVMRTFCIFSDDHGRSWHGARDITGAVHRPYQPAYAAVCPAAAQPENQAHDWRIQVPMLGHAIQLQGPAPVPGCPPAPSPVRGRILHIGSRTRSGDSVFGSMNYAFWSDDLGETWQVGDFITTRWDGSPARGLNEATAVELADGRVLVNSRNYRDGEPVRQRAVTIGAFARDGHLTFGSARHDSTLVEPAVQASLLRYTWPGPAGSGGCSRILFANPAHPFARTNMTVRLSYDEGATWPIARLIDPGPERLQRPGRAG